jgi:glycerophosphoryl diester phosphodiesterase
MPLFKFALPDPLGPIDRALAPAPSRKRIAALVATPYAHRGLHGGKIPENSRAAFVAAITEGHGIELDVVASRNGEAMVFHDYDLARLTGRPGRVAELSSGELVRLPLAGSNETIPTLSEALGVIAGQVPLLIEVKAPERQVAPLCLAVLRSLDGYRGPVGVMSFNPEVGRWFAQHGERVPRGLVVTEAGKRRLRGGVERRLGLWRARPDFLAYDIRDLPSRTARRARGRGMPVLTWTCRSREERERAASHADQIIYEPS